MSIFKMNTASRSRFITFKQFFFEGVDFNKLPENLPYGFWVSADTVIPVNSNGHIVAATQYLSKDRRLEQGSLYTQMYNRGFVRVVNVKSDDACYIQSSKAKPNITARKVARDIALYYGLQPYIENDPIFTESADIDLPESAPYGFWVKYNEVIPVRGGPGAHWHVGKAYLAKKGHNTSFVHETLFKLGFVRCVSDVLSDGMEIEFKPGITPKESIKKAEDIAEFYNTVPYISAVKD